ncbi:hypothetical protein GCM10009775_18210 [Microbacterium aoyamense]|uniref:Glycosyltransferase RgtA/B/C/D-like domain-containing protein n=1 Tax=Microbacterium aoyamense TaxID=344166 RepID=A0ABN2PMY1_9MICO|nr:DUF6541 family protein [Microbacterium aoyamense]
MNGEWLIAVPPFLVATAFFVVPGLIVRLAGWSARSLTPYFLVPAVSVAIVAVSSNVAGIVGVSWSPVPVAVVTVIAAVAAWGLRRWVGGEDVPRPSARRIAAAVGGFLLAMVVLLIQLTHLFGAPENISQTFDNIVHLNSIRFALDNADASAVGIGRTSDIGFYPNAWHSFTTLTAQLTGVSVPLAVNATNLAVGAVVWPLSAMALAATLFRERAAALLSSAAISTAFGAFPILLLSFGVLYPNTMGYSIVAAGVAAVILLLRATTPATRVRQGVLLVVIAVGVLLGHPNAFLSLFAFGSFLTAAILLDQSLRAKSRRVWVVNAAVVGVLLVVGALLWAFWRTGSGMSQWAAWQSGAQAFGEALLISPGAKPVTIVTAVLLLVGVVAIARRPRLIVIAIPFAVAGLLFVVASGVPAGTFWRDAITNPWYNDSFRLAALLPIAGIPLATLGAVTIVDAARGLLRRWSVRSSFATAIGAVAAVALFLVGFGPNVTATAEQWRSSYQFSTGWLLSTDESALLSRLDENTPDDALILGNPWTGTSLAYALSERDVVQKHVYVARDEDETFLDLHLRDIDSDPEVCAAVDRIGVTHVLDFGDQAVFASDATALQAGLNNLVPSEHLVLVDSEGPSARLFRIEGC